MIYRLLLADAWFESILLVQPLSNADKNPAQREKTYATLRNVLFHSIDLKLREQPGSLVTIRIRHSMPTFTHLTDLL